jgi:hypothetical protein
VAHFDFLELRRDFYPRVQVREISGKSQGKVRENSGKIQGKNVAKSIRDDVGELIQYGTRDMGR